MARRTTAQPPVLPGYTFVRPLGAGGFSDVFQYEQDMPRRVVAVKVLVDDAINPDVLRTFNAEADVLARLSTHPSIVTIFQASISGDGRPYFVMEYCPDNMGARYRQAPLSVAQVLDVGVRIAAALETAHRAGVLHRDVKPANVLITSLGAPALADFGIARPVAEGTEIPEDFAMSIPWSAPEVLLGRVSGSIASEIWGIGATLYTLLAGRAPFELPSGERIPRAQLQERTIKTKYVPTGRQDITERLENTLKRALEKDPAKRHASMLEFAEELRWAQYELGLPPTAFDVVDSAWAAAVAPINFDSMTPRGPVMSTVKSDSRRSARAQVLASSQRISKPNPEVPAGSASTKKSVALAAAIGAATALVVAVVVLFAIGAL